jgi:TolB protein
VVRPVPYRVVMADPLVFDDPGPLIPEPPSRGRRALTVALLLTLVVSIVFLAFISGRGVVRVTPVVLPSPSVVTASPVAARLAVVDTGGRLLTTDAAGGSVVPYGAAGTVFSLPTWSPDGSRIAAIGASADAIGVDVFTVHAGGVAAVDPTVVYQSPDRPPFYLYWAPDSRRLTFLTTEPDGLALRLAPADASAPAAIIRSGAPIYWAWADPTRLLVHSGDGGPDGFFGEIAADGASVEPDLIAPGGFRAPAVTSDGRFRAFVAPGDGTPAQIVVEARDRTNPHALDVFGEAAIDFGPRTNELAFIAPTVAGGDVPLPVGPLRLMDAASGQVRTILTGSVVAFFWAPDGRTIAALEIAGTGGDQVARVGDAVSAATTVASPSPGPSPAPGAALRLVFVTADTGAIRSQRAVRVSDTFVQQVLPFFDQYALSHRLWSPDGASIVLPVVADGGTDQLEVLRADGSDPRTVAGGVVGFWSP